MMIYDSIRLLAADHGYRDPYLLAQNPLPSKHLEETDHGRHPDHRPA